MSDKTTVRVRIAVAVDCQDNWAAAARSGVDDGDKREMVFLDGAGEGEHWHWVEADVPVPTETTIEGLTDAG